MRTILRFYPLPAGLAVLGICGGGPAAVPKEGAAIFYDSAALDVPKYILHYVIEGRGWYQDEGAEPVPLGPGDVFQRIPGRRHRSWWEPLPRRDWYLFCNADLLQAFHTLDLLPLPGPVLHLGIRDEIQAAFGRLHQAMVDHREWGEVLLLVHRLAALLRQSSQHDRDEADWLQRARSVLEDPCAALNLPEVGPPYGHRHGPRTLPDPSSHRNRLPTAGRPTGHGGRAAPRIAPTGAKPS